MRILVLQLARLGDIYQTWPALNALKRKHPEAEVHLLVRERFREATEGLDGLRVHALPNRAIFESIVVNGDEHEALARFKGFLDDLDGIKFDTIVNLSFSPVSSFITDYLAGEHTSVRGYTRHNDGFLAIPDDASAYFYAQAGIGRANRFHLTEIFASVADVELQEEDFGFFRRTTVRKNQIVIHAGASSTDKIYPAEYWVEAVQKLLQSFDGRIILVGSSNERDLNETIKTEVADPRVENHSGQTQLPELFYVVEESRLLIGGDSCPIHMSTLKGTPVLNLSCAAVNFWETGPCTPGSRVLWARTMDKISPERVAAEAVAMLGAQPPSSPCWIKPAWRENFAAFKMKDDDFEWKLIEALYTGADFPPAASDQDGFAFRRLYELAELALAEMSGPLDNSMLGKIDELLEELPKLNRHVEPALQWFQTERVRIPPGSREEILGHTRKAFENLAWVAAVYCQEETHTERLTKAMRLCRTCGSEIREWNFAAVQNDFQALTSALEALAQTKPKVGNETWASVLHRIHTSLGRRDFVELADLLEWELTSCLECELKQEETSAQDVLF